MATLVSMGRGAEKSVRARGRRPGRPRRSPIRPQEPIVVDLVSDSGSEEEVGASGARVGQGPAYSRNGEGAEGCPRAHDGYSDSDSEEEGTRAAERLRLRPPAPRRRRLLLGAGEAPAVPVYSGKVKSSLRFFPKDFRHPLFNENPSEEVVDLDSDRPLSEAIYLPVSSSEKRPKANDEEEENQFLVQDSSPSPSPPPRRRGPSRKAPTALGKIREVNKRLQGLRSYLSPLSSKDRVSQNSEDEVILVEEAYAVESSRPLTLKVRCRADLVRLPLSTAEPLQVVVDHMASRLGVSPARILLLFGEVQLSPSATPSSLKIGVADIIDCVVLSSTPEPSKESGSGEELRLRVQGQEKHQVLEVTIPRGAPLRTLMSHYAEAMGLKGHKLSFFFDGEKLSGQGTPAELGMEQEDLIEVRG
ncbi:NFATC2-interacting protein isoform X3 [Monodelphis domestica]|uniref:NFATC2-interacting protein isoform X3 n=1 Tax=Monodelphis domestica TaxID=13616 RepID=UPI00005E8231|nr:NFATC2-interacting protein isoform X3 [Monodelphis domestica]